MRATERPIVFTAVDPASGVRKEWSLDIREHGIELREKGHREVTGHMQFSTLVEASILNRIGLLVMRMRKTVTRELQREGARP